MLHPRRRVDYHALPPAAMCEITPRAVDAVPGYRYLPATTMKANLRYWRAVLLEAERELEAAKTRTALDEAASKLMGARVKLKRLQASVSVVRSSNELQTFGRAFSTPPGRHLRGSDRRARPKPASGTGRRP
jgi:hypothetical protein